GSLAVGDWVRADGGTNQGRALGKYQYMSYREEVVEIFSQKKGGLDLLKRIEQDSISASEIQRQLPTYFLQKPKSGSGSRILGIGLTVLTIRASATQS
ncbi:hypothetical protein HC931_26155, partial [Candidatus Gracilibacteria bacterium]|nr:hypothetical protein [Candidatus Gracilibacteria bacterium]